jgi:hypothetical protein
MENGMTSRGVFYVDGNERGLYDDVVLPPNWTLHIAEHAGLSAALDWCLATYPDESNYGWLADDMCPMTPGWDWTLEQAAGECFMSQARDDWVFNMWPEQAANGSEPTAGHCWGGKLMRAVGWWALPGTVQAGTDVAWARLVYDSERMRFCDTVTVEHRQWRTGKRPRDKLDTDMNDSNGHAHTERDLELLFAWLRGPDYNRAQRRIGRACR